MGGRLEWEVGRKVRVGERLGGRLDCEGGREEG